MLIDLQSLDVVICQCDADGASDDQDANTSLGSQSSAKCSPRYHNGASITDQGKEYDGVAVDAMEEKEFLADLGDELEDQRGEGEDGAEMDGHADSVDTGPVGVPFALRCALREAAGG